MINQLKEMLLEFLAITAGITISTTVFCTIFDYNIYFGIGLLWQIVGLSFLCTLLGIIYVSKRELTKKQMLSRQIIHMGVLLILILFLAYRWQWIDAHSVIQPIVIIIMFLGVYSMVTYVTYIRDKKVAMMLNERLQKFKQKNMD